MVLGQLVWSQVVIWIGCKRFWKIIFKSRCLRSLNLSKSRQSRNGQQNSCQSERWQESKCLASEGLDCAFGLDNLLLCALAFMSVEKFHFIPSLSFYMLGNVYCMVRCGFDKDTISV